MDPWSLFHFPWQLRINDLGQFTFSSICHIVIDVFFCSCSAQVQRFVSPVGQSLILMELNMMKDVLEVHKIYIRFTSWKQTCYFSMAVLLQEYLVCLEREDVGFGLSEDNIKRFNVGEAVYGPGLLHGLVGNWLTIDKSQTFWIITVSTISQYSLTENETKKKPKAGLAVPGKVVGVGYAGRLRQWKAAKHWRHVNRGAKAWMWR